MQQPGKLACFASRDYVVIASSSALEAETGANPPSLARVEPGAECPTTWFEMQSVQLYTKTSEGASSLGRAPLA